MSVTARWATVAFLGLLLAVAVLARFEVVECSIPVRLSTSGSGYCVVLDRWTGSIDSRAP
jgi:hypothetical protein